MGEWDLGYPVNFTPTGDTTSQALEKHINEFNQVYGYLNRLRKLDTGINAPTDPVQDHLWLDTSNGMPILRRYDASSGTWVVVDRITKSLSDVVTLIGSDNVRLAVSSTIDILTDVTIPSNVFIDFVYPGKFNVQTQAITGESVGTGDGTTTVFNLQESPVLENSETVYVDGTAQTRDTDYTIDYDTGQITFTTAPASGAAITADYTHQYVLTLNCGFRAGLWQIFDGDGIVTGSPKIEAVYPEWFGDLLSGDTLEKTLIFVNTIGGSIIFLDFKGQVLQLTNTLDVVLNNTKIIGIGGRDNNIIQPPTSWETDVNTVALKITGDNNLIEGISIVGGDTTTVRWDSATNTGGKGLQTLGANNIIKNCSFKHVGGEGILIGEAGAYNSNYNNNVVEQCYFYNCNQAIVLAGYSNVAKQNHIEYCYEGIGDWGGSENSVFSNKLNNIKGYAIEASESGSSKIIGNEIKDSYCSILGSNNHGITIVGNRIVQSSDINDSNFVCVFGIKITDINNTIEGKGTNFSICGNVINSPVTPIASYTSPVHAFTGILVQYAHEGTISGNTVIGLTKGCVLATAYHTSVVGNIFSNDPWTFSSQDNYRNYNNDETIGIFLSTSLGCSVSGNIVAYKGTGILIDTANTNTSNVVGNTIKNCTKTIDVTAGWRYAYPQIQGNYITASEGYSDSGDLNLQTFMYEGIPQAGNWKAGQRFRAGRSSNIIEYVCVTDGALYKEAWSSTSTYIAGDWVLGSDGYVYRALKDGGEAQDPTTDTNNIYWVLENQAVAEFITVGFRNDKWTSEDVQAATTLGTVVKKIAVYDKDGNVVGYLPIYDAIT